jgi:hypothetical protein
MEAVRTSEASVDNHFTRQYNPEDNSEHHTRRRENLKSHIFISYNRGHQASMLILLLGDATMWHHYQLTLALMMEAP